MKLYVIVDSTLPPGAQAAQACHTMRSFAAEHPAAERAWYDGSNNLVILAATDERHLHALLRSAGSAGIASSSFREPDLGNRLTGIAMIGAERLVSDLPLALRVQKSVAA